MNRYALMDFQRQTAIHCQYKAWKSQDNFYITLFVFILMK